MVITHVFEMFYIPDYDRRLTYYVTIGFVFLSGFTVGARYSEKTRANPRESAKKLMSRGYKLLLVYAISNFLVLLIRRSKFDILIESTPLDIVMSVFLGTNQRLFGFDILVPIALTSIFSWVLLKLFNNWVQLAAIFLFALLLRVFETENLLDYYGVKLLVIGLMGCLAGSLLRKLDWQNALGTLLRYHATLMSGMVVLLYYITMIVFSGGNAPIMVHYHVIPTVVMLLFVYMLSYVFHLGENFLIKLLNMTLAKYMLFAYLFHILLINVLFLWVRHDSLGFMHTLAVGVFVLLMTVAACYFVELTTSKSPICARIYSTGFKL